MNSYKNRVVDGILARKLQGTGAILVEGAKWCGKTTTCEQVAKSVLYLGDPDVRDNYLRLAEISLGSLLEGERPRLIDEWQDVPRLWDAVRFKVDHLEGWGHFILTGSSVPPDVSRIAHSGAGRFARVKMRPMTLWESGESSGEVSLAGLMSGTDFQAGKANALNLGDLAYLLCRGGWPEAVAQGGDLALERAKDYYAVVVEADITRADGVPRDPERVKRLMRSYARLQGTQSNLAAIRRDMLAHEPRELSELTIKSYLNALKRIFVVEDVPAWSPCLRSKSVVRTSDTRYFVDPSVVTAALNATPSDLTGDMRTLGYVFETMAIRDLRVYADAQRGTVSHYLDRNGLECDAIVHLDHGEYGLIEIKLGGETLIEDGARTLNALANIVDVDRMKPPSFKMVLTGVGDFAYRRKEDGVIVCPIAALRP